MSSLAATQADGYYVPPDYYDSGAYKKQTKNQFNKSKGHNQFLTNGVCRFELPYNGICLNEKCGQIIRRGTRFNAKKTECKEMYYTSKIYEFRMNCRRCGDCEFVIRTNPQGRCFDYLSGIKEKQEEFDTIEAGSLGVIDTDVGNGILPSAMVKGKGSLNIDANDDIAIMERQNASIRRANNQMDQLKQVYKFQRECMLDDAASNSKLRTAFRVDRKAKKKRQLNASALGLGRGIELSDEIDDDGKIAKGAFDQSFHIQHLKVVKREKNTFQRVRTESIFSNHCRTNVKIASSMKAGRSGRLRVKVEDNPNDRKRKTEFSISPPHNRTVAELVTSNAMSNGDVTDKVKIISTNESSCDVVGISALSALADYDST
uniref:Uncharacterized protein n=1 Tax=Leptocylindrus danicus TaxID=163516 RepID=A0A7S2LH83_9STRA